MNWASEALTQSVTAREANWIKRNLWKKKIRRRKKEGGGVLSRNIPASSALTRMYGERNTGGKARWDRKKPKKKKKAK